MEGWRANILIAAGILALVLGGCAGGNRLISNRGGQVESGELDLRNVPARPEPEEYVIGHGDVLDILFFYNRDLNQTEVKVRPDGKISLPYLGDIVAVGRPVSVLDSILTAQYSEILVKPNVTVVVRNYKPQVVYVLGEVKDPGGYPYEKGTTLLDFLAIGGGPNMNGKRNAVVVIRRVGPDHVVGIQIDVNELLDKKRFDLNLPLEPFDIIYVPKSELAKAKDFVQALADLLVTPADLYLKGWNVANAKILYDYYRKQGQQVIGH